MKEYALITGASRGIGKAIVERLAKDHSNKIIALSRNTKSMESFSSFSNVKTFGFDLNKDVQKQASEIFKSVDSIDILINNAGYLVNKPFGEITKEDFDACYQVNVIGVMQTVQAALPKMTEKGGHIVNISSMGGFQGSMKFAGLTAYSTSKAAVCSFTEMFAEEYKDSKVKMNCLCLGAVQTKMLEKAFQGFKAELSPVEMGSFIFDFACKQARFLNGKIIPVSLSTP